MDCLSVIITTVFTVLLIGLTCEACTCVEFRNLPASITRPGKFCVDGTRFNGRPVYLDSDKGNYLYYDSVNFMWKAGRTKTTFYLAKRSNDTVYQIAFERGWMIKRTNGRLVSDNNPCLACSKAKDHHDVTVEPSQSSNSTTAKVSAPLSIIGVVVMVILYCLTKRNIKLCDVCACCCEVVRACLQAICSCCPSGSSNRARRRRHSTTDEVIEIRVDEPNEDIPVETRSLFESTTSISLAEYTEDLFASSDRPDLPEAITTSPTAPPPLYDRALHMPRPPPRPGHSLDTLPVYEQALDMSPTPPAYDQLLGTRGPVLGQGQSLDTPRPSSVTDQSLSLPHPPPVSDQSLDTTPPPPGYDQSLASPGPPPGYDQSLTIPPPPPTYDQLRGAPPPPPEYEQALDTSRPPARYDPALATPRPPTVAD